MKFIKDLISRKPSEAAAEVKPLEEVVAARVNKKKVDQAPVSEAPKSANLTVVTEDAPTATATPARRGKAKPADHAADILDKVNAEVAKPAEEAAVNIWDMDGEDAAVEEAAPTPRRRRNKTRLLGFDGGDSDVVSMFDKAETKAPTARAKFPVGWVLVAEGPGRGECFTLEAGMSQIGRGEDQAIQLDFGDNAVSRMNHAAIVYDVDTHAFMLGHGGKKNVVRLNGKPVISNENLNTGDEIKIGETTLRFVACCNEDFNWATDAGSEENEDVAIA